MYTYLSNPSQFDKNLSKYGLIGKHVIHGEDALVPQIDVYSRGEETVIHAELPGIKKEDLAIDVIDDGRFLAISGFNCRDEKYKEGHAYIRERHFGRFKRTIHLPAGSDPFKAKAKFEHGVLMVTVPKSQKETHCRVEIN